MAEPIVDIRSTGEFEKWVIDKPIEWALALALRTALRVLPFVAEFGSYAALSPQEKSDVYLATFRVAHSSWAALSFPDSFLPIITGVHSARVASRMAGHAAGVSGAAGAARVTYALADIARATEVKELRYAIRSVEDATSAGEAALSLALQGLWLELSLDATTLLQRDVVNVEQILLGKRLWRADDASWQRTALAKLERVLRKDSDTLWEYWLEWYGARVKGSNEYNLSGKWVEEISKRVISQSDEWWKAAPEIVAARVALWVDEARASPDSKEKTISEFIIGYLEEANEPASARKIIEAFTAVKRNVIPKSVHGDLSRLASSGQIRRVAPGIYQSVSAISPKEIGQIEPQTIGAIQFAGYENAPIDVVPKASTGELRTDPNARKRHGEVLRRADALLARYSRAEQGGNTSSAIVDEVSLFRESLGSSVEEVDPDLLIPRGDGLRRDLAAYKDRDDFSKLPPVPDDLLLNLGKLVTGYNNFVSYDAELARRDEALLGPDARRKLIPPYEGQKILEEAVKIGAASRNVVIVLSEEAKVAPEIPDPESRQSRRYSEGTKNFARIALERATDFARLAWKHKGKALAGLGFSYYAAQWVVAHELWLLKYFAGNPAMMDIITKLLRFLHELPLT